MNGKSNCPQADELRQLLDGSLSSAQVEACTEHMGSCQGCQSRLENLATDGTNLSSIVESIDESGPPVNSGYWAAARQLEASVEETFVPVATARRREVSLNFLEPASDSAYLGRLAHFDVMRMLGRGGMGVVLEAFDSKLQRNVALKVLDPEFAGDEVSRQRFCREARSAASITHENVVAVHQVEKSSEDGLPYLVMQLITGESLEQRLTRQKRLPTREVIRIGMQTAHGLAAAYGQGLIHRDIKPGNILLEEAHDRVKLTDFGLARATEDVKLTRTGFVSGTPLYMAPEQAMGEDADHRSDLFSLGAIMYEMCAGRPPFMGNSALQILRQINDTPHRPLREVDPNIPEWLAETIDRLLAKKPEDRIQSAEHLAELLEFQLALMRTSEDVPTVCKIAQAKQRKRNRRIATVIGAGFLTIGLLAGMLITNLPHSAKNDASGDASNAVPPAVVHAEGKSSAEPLAVFGANAGTVWSVAFDQKNQIVAMGVEDGSVRLWDLATKSVKSTFTAHRGTAWNVQFVPQSGLLATSGDDGMIKIWDLTQSDPIRTFKHPMAVRSMVFSNDGKLIYAGDRDGGLKVWSVDSDEPLLQTQQPSAIYSVAVSPDNSTVATGGSDKVVRLWNAKTLTLKMPLEGHSGQIYGVSFSPDGHRLASAGWDKQVRIWDTDSGSLLKSWSGQGADIWGVVYSPDGTKLATGGFDGAVKIWNTETGELLARYLGEQTVVHSIAISGDGKQVASGGRDGSTKIWPMP